MITRPMKAVEAGDLSKLIYPRYASAKLDGIRCLKVNGKALSASFKPIRNIYVRNYIESTMLPDGFDGELVLAGTKAFNEVSSAIMSEAGTPDFRYALFDHVKDGNIDEPFIYRYERLKNFILPSFAYVLEQRIVKSAEELSLFEEECIAEGYEGVITRSLAGPYKCGRSTLREQYMLKMKRFVDTEGIIIGMEEMEHNTNPAFEGELGQTKRSSAQIGKVSSGVMGALVVEEIKTGVVSKVGTGFSAAEREWFWQEKISAITQRWIVTFKHMPYGAVEKHRSGVYKGIRHKEDMTSF